MLYTNTPTMRDYISIINEEGTFDQQGNQVPDPKPNTPEVNSAPSTAMQRSTASSGLSPDKKRQLLSIVKSAKLKRWSRGALILALTELGWELSSRLIDYAISLFDSDDSDEPELTAPPVQGTSPKTDYKPLSSFAKQSQPPVGKPKTTNKSTGTTSKSAGSAKCTYKPDVAKWQELLNANGAKLKVDGCYGPKTQAAYDLIFGKDNKPRQDFEKNSSAYQSSTGYTPTPYSDSNPYNYVEQERAAQQAAADARIANSNMYEHDLHNKVSGLREYISLLSEDQSQNLQNLYRAFGSTQQPAQQPQQSTQPSPDTDSDVDGVYDQHQMRKGNQQDLQNLYRGFRSEPQPPVSQVPSAPDPSTQYNSAGNPPSNYEDNEDTDGLLSLPKATPEQLKWLQQYQQRTQSQSGILGGKGPLRMAETASSAEFDRENSVNIPGIGVLSPTELDKLKQCYTASVKPAASARIVSTSTPNATTGSIAKAPASGSIRSASNANFSKSKAASMPNTAAIGRMGVNESTNLARMIQLVNHQK